MSVRLHMIALAEIRAEATIACICAQLIEEQGGGGVSSVPCVSAISPATGLPAFVTSVCTLIGCCLYGEVQVNTCAIVCCKAS